MTPWQEELAILRVARGALYRKRRDALLAGFPDALRRTLPQLSTSPDAGQATTASILMGWLDHRVLYTSVLAELDGVDADRVGASQIGFHMIWNGLAERAERQWGTAVLPLAWEEITRFEQGAPAWRVVAFLYIVRSVPDARSIAPVVAALEATPSDDVARACAATLHDLPVDAVKARADACLQRHRLRVSLYQRIVRGERP